MEWEEHTVDITADEAIDPPQPGTKSKLTAAIDWLKTRLATGLSKMHRRSGLRQIRCREPESGWPFVPSNARASTVSGSSLFLTPLMIALIALRILMMFNKAIKIIKMIMSAKEDLCFDHPGTGSRGGRVLSLAPSGVASCL